MSLDGIALNSICYDLNQKLIEARVDRIFQPNPYELTFDLRQKGIVRKMLISIHPQFARIQLNPTKRANPVTPPHFCLFLRKTLEGARIESIEQPDYERILIFNFQSRDELGNPATFRLIVELMGKYSNIILVNEEDRILEALRHVNSIQSRVREVLPALDYVFPPRPIKSQPETWQAPRNDDELTDGNSEIASWLSKSIEGLSPTIVRSLLKQCRIPDNLKASYLRLEDWLLIQASLHDLLNTRQPGKLFLYKDMTSTLLSSVKFTDWVNGSWLEASEALEIYYAEKETTLQLEQQRHRLASISRAAEERGLRKKNALEEDYSNAKESDHLRVWAELLKMAPNPERRLNEIELVNFYDPDLQTIVVPLDQRLNISQNAQAMFKRYSRYRNGEKVIAAQLETLQTELVYLASVNLAIEQALTPDDLREIQVELVEQGYIAPEKTRSTKGKNKSKPHIQASLPLIFEIEGIEILIGRNNRQNDELTWKLARSDDTWLHAKDIPGSHLLIRSSDPSNSVLEKAARLAAWFSKARESGLVAVDITLRRNLKKPRGARPGFVIYTNQRTVYITPLDPLLVNVQTV